MGGIETEWLLPMTLETNPATFVVIISTLRCVRHLPQSDVCLGALLKTASGAGSISDGCIQLHHARLPTNARLRWTEGW
jgi:hypothetical protein